jgi:carbamoyltransferase
LFSNYSMYLGINAYSHDSSACLLDEDGVIIAAAEEERFTEIKHYKIFPENAIKFCLEQASITTQDLKGVAVGWQPRRIIVDRILRQYLFRCWPSYLVFKKSIIKLSRLLMLRKRIEKSIGKLPTAVKIQYIRHHVAHAASAFYASGFDDAAFFTIDARGERDSSLWGVADYKNGIQDIGTIEHPHSLGCLWGAITEYCGFTPGWSKTGTVMALAALGEPKYMKEFEQMIKFTSERDNSWLKVDLNYFIFNDCKGRVSKKFESLFGAKACKWGEDTQVHRDVAATMQAFSTHVVTEKLKEIHKITGESKLVMAGGVCLNSVTNGLILDKTPFTEMFIQPAANDAGASLGAAYMSQQSSKEAKKPPAMSHAYLGPEYSSQEIQRVLDQYNERFHYKEDENIAKTTARLIHQGKVVMWFQGRLEFGPRALGARSILASATDADVIDELNKTKQRESFRPFAISILEDQADRWLENGRKAPFMLLVDHVKESLKSRVPAAQHIDGSVRAQTVNQADNGIYFDLLEEYNRLSDIPLIINTSFNIGGLPIVNNPSQAVRAFIESKDVKHLAIGPYLVTKIV